MNEQELKTYVTSLDSDLEEDVSLRLYGISSKISSRGGYKFVGYQILRDFFEGDQWTYAKPNNTTMRTYNFCATTVYNYTAFLAGSPPEFDVPPDDITDDIEVATAEAKEEYLSKIMEQNQFPIQFEESVLVGSELGDSFIIGPFYNKQEKKIWFAPVRKPEYIRPIFSNRDFNELVGFIHHYRVTKDKAMELWGDKIVARKITLQPEKTVEPGEHQMEMVDVIQYWDKKYMLLMLGDSSGNKVIDSDEHNWGFVPLIHVRNQLHPNYAWGVSDIEGMLDAQIEYNEAASYTSDVLRAAALPHIFGRNLSISEYNAGVAQIIDTGDESELFPNPMSGMTAPWEMYLNSRQADIWSLSGINEIVYGGSRVREATGRALSVLMQGVQNRIKGRQERWAVALKHLVAGIFRLTELYVKNGKDLIQGKYEVNIFFPSTLMRDVQQEINKFNFKLQSQATTMKNLGVPSPVRETKLIKKELDDNQLMVEVSKNPALHLQIAQMAQMAQQQAAANRAGGPMLNEGENQGEQPMAAPGAPSGASAGGAVQQAAQRSGAPAVLK